jgi:23S rRNA (pseudouridine1915-N3)-methyltransferase
MKLHFLAFETKAPDWLEIGRREYLGKISVFLPMEFQLLKSPVADRSQAAIKLRREAELLLKQIDDKDYLVLFDESGKLCRSSEDFAHELGRALESGKARIVFCIGGPYGFDPSIRKRAQALWSLSPLTMNHWIAQVAALEQIYRGFTIRKGIPYHNR